MTIRVLEIPVGGEEEKRSVDYQENKGEAERGREMRTRGEEEERRGMEDGRFLVVRVLKIPDEENKELENKGEEGRGRG